MAIAFIVVIAKQSCKFLALRCLPPGARRRRSYRRNVRVRHHVDGVASGPIGPGPVTEDQAKAGRAARQALGSAYSVHIRRDAQ